MRFGPNTQIVLSTIHDLTSVPAVVLSEEEFSAEENGTLYLETLIDYGEGMITELQRRFGTTAARECRPVINNSRLMSHENDQGENLGKYSHKTTRSCK